MSGKVIDLTGMQFGELTVCYDSGEKSHGNVVWTCKCACGNVTNVNSGNLIRGNTKSCGHLRGKWITHGCTDTPEYTTWSSMIKRCTNPKDESYHNYGGRGIRVCDRWLHAFENFYADMGPRTSNSHSVDRRDNDGNYEPGNCYWATKEEQDNNRRTNRIVYFKDKKYTIAQLSKEYGIEYGTLLQRLNRGWPVERAVETTSINYNNNLSI